LQLLAPEQSPVQPAKVKPKDAVAASVTCVPDAKSRVQVEKQSVRPPGKTIKTLPVPTTVAVNVTCASATTVVA
jgi:hypothetical protein